MMKMKRHWDAPRCLLERDCHELFGIGFGPLCKRLGINTNTALAQVRRGIPMHVALGGVAALPSPAPEGIEANFTVIEDSK